MLGHTAIAALGGCYSQNPDTGACEATYFPAEYIDISNGYMKRTARDAGTTTFEQGFTQTRFWTKQQRFSGTVLSYPAFILLGTLYSGSGPRTWVQCGVGPGSNPGVQHIVGESVLTISPQWNPTLVWTCSKDSGSNTSVMTDGSITSRRTTTEYPVSMTSSAFYFQSGTPSPATATLVRFWGDLMSNEPYGIRFRRLPMRSAENEFSALYDADAQQLVEY